MKYGLELEFFVKNAENKIIPAYTVTNNVDGNPVIGELRTSICDNIVDAIFELKKLIHLESVKLLAKKCAIFSVNHIKVDNDFLVALRKDRNYVNAKELEVLEELSIYPKGKIGKMLPRGIYKASLQINMSSNKTFSYPTYEKVQVEDKIKYVESSKQKQHSEIFDYVKIIHKLDMAFAKDIKDSQRVAGVYAIKNGELGSRLEYRSLPNTVSFDKILEVLQ